ncbi:MAG: hypothetical protein JSR44_16100 [Spirochaetes bacterium]|nr:hypothetical protein [Spirochaetota bacterium]
MIWIKSNQKIFLAFCALATPLATSFAVEEKTLRVEKPVVIQAESSAPVALAKKKLVFLDFYNESNDPNTKWLTDSIGDSIYELTKNKYNYTRIDNKVWRDYTTAHNFKPADFYDTEKLQKMGYDLHLDGIVFGKFVATKENIQISGKILSVVDKDIIAEKNVTVPFSSQMFEDVQEVSETLGSRIKDLFFPSDRGALWRSALLPGWGQFYKQRKTWGYIYSGTVGTSFAFTVFSFIMWQSANQQYKNYDPAHVTTPQGETGIIDPASTQAQFNAYVQKSQTWQQITLISGVITMTLYLWQLFDAWFFEGNYTQISKSLAGDISRRRNLLGSGVMFTGDREPFSLKLGLRF